ncbi:unnamed protein product [Clonostachys chloroleuca]|uniref:Vegetative incompatibility protein HET-E-1 n=1 Tax=Clonostachys chloroleuca TaxID=1926264 RepID=A0AA35M9J6_9HYPO|nr:unnamed protein product [Clonostachys chloroleuca]
MGEPPKYSPQGEPPKYSPTPHATVEDQFAAVLVDAAKQYQESSGQSLEDFLKPPMKSIDELKAQLVTQNDKFSSFREKRHHIFGALSAMLEPVQVIGEVVGGALSETYPPVQTVFSAVAYLINAANNVSSMYDKIVELFENLKGFTLRLDLYLQSEMSPALRGHVVSILASLFQVLVLSTKEIKRGRVKAYFKGLFGAGSPVQPALENLKNLTQTEALHVQAEIYKDTKRMGLTTDRVESLVNEVNENVQSLRSEYRERTTLAQQDKLRDILGPSPFPEDYYSLFTKSIVRGTGEWLLKDEGVKSWFNGQTKYLWISGGAGTGKSFLATRLISQATEDLQHVGYFYFRANDPETRSVLQALRDVAYQLSESDAYYGKQIVRNLHSGDDIKTLSSAYRRLFIEPFEKDKRGRNFYVFLDGIDEADTSEMEEFLSLLTPELDEQGSKGLSKVYLALIGRSYMSEQVTQFLDPDEKSDQVSTTLVTPERNAKDVGVFIEYEISNSRILSRSTPEFRKEIIDEMVKRVDGLFILAKLMLADVNRARRPSSILKSLKTYPREINAILQKTLSDLASTMSDEEATDLNEMLMWVSCAEQALTLEQLEAALIMKYGDLPFRFEELLRGQYACFFDLQREDGLTTDDLIKDHERTHHRARSQGSTPGDRSRRSSSAGKDSPSRRVHPAQKLINSQRRRTSPSSLGTSPPDRAFSPSRSPGLRALAFETQELEFRSNKATTTVNLFHTSLREFFRDHDTTTTIRHENEAVTVGFPPIDAKIHVLKTCIRIFSDKKWFSEQKLKYRRKGIKQYAAWYWQEHLEAIDLSKVSREDKKEIGPQLYKMLTDEQMIYEWTIMYEENDEGLEVLADKSIRVLLQWMGDADVLAGLEPKARDWARQAVDTPTGIYQAIGRFYAKAWLAADFELYIPANFCFKIVQTIAFMDKGYSWADSQCRWSSIPLADRIAKAAEWTGLPKNAQWYRRIGSSYLTSGEHHKALYFYDKALELDSNSVESRGRKAFCLFKDELYEKALDLSLECEAAEIKAINEGKLSTEHLAESRWRLYKDQFVIAQCYYLTDQVNASVRYFEKAIQSVEIVLLRKSERFEAVIAYLRILAVENRHADMMKLVEDLSLKATSRSREQSRLVDLFLSEYNMPLVQEWLPKAACKVDQSEFLLQKFDMAIGAAHAVRNTLKELYLRLAIGTTLMLKRDNDGAIEIFERISLVEFRPRGNVPTRQAHAISFQRLASLYKQKVLHIGIKSHGADAWIERLETVMDRQGAQQNLDMPASMLGSDVNTAAIYLSLFYRLRGRAAEAKKLLGALIVESCEILEDDELRNDQFALENLVKLFTAADDVENATALAVSMRKVNPQESIRTDTVSPVESREFPEPKLPDIQSSNRSCGQCLETIPHHEEFSFCRFCLDSFCVRCLKMIKTDNAAVDIRGDEVVCRSTHDWFSVPPLNKILHTGQMLFGDLDVRDFVEWKNGIKRQWDAERKKPLKV